MIAPAIIESCPQRILLPNDRAIEPQSRDAYERFGLNDRHIELVSRATPKRQYYLQSARGHRLFELVLGPLALALCGPPGPATQARKIRRAPSKERVSQDVQIPVVAASLQET